MAANPLSAWQEGGRDYVPPAERIATFDNDGTLWCEQPLHDAEREFAYDRDFTVVEMTRDCKVVFSAPAR